MSTETTVGEVFAKSLTSLASITSGIALPAIAEWEPVVKICCMLVGAAYPAYALYDLHQRRRREQARRDAGQDTQRGAP